MNYNIHLENFDGPMDLLLHLVKQTKLDIYEIPVSEIIEGYLSYIRTLQCLNIDIGGEFLLMASSLVHLKSKLLIGKTNEEEIDAEEEFSIESEEDLRNKILEYEKYKELTKDLQKLEEKRGEIYTKVPQNKKEYMETPELFNEGLTIDDLMAAFLNLEARIHYKEPVETKITRKEISVGERVLRIRDVLRIRKKCFFEELFEVPTKDYMIATFLAILEMSKSSEIRLFQEENFKRIEVEALG